MNGEENIPGRGDSKDLALEGNRPVWLELSEVEHGRG